MAADWTERRAKVSGRTSLLNPLSHSQKPLPPPGNAPLAFTVSNRGPAPAERINIFIEIPSGCRLLEPQQQSDYFSLAISPVIKPSWSCYRSGPDGLRIVGDRLDPALVVTEPAPNWVVYSEPDRSYEFKYTATCSNRVEPTSGVLTVHLAGKETPPTKTFPGYRLY